MIVLGLGQDAPVEGEQTEFAVEIVLGREAGGQVGMVHRARSKVMSEVYSSSPSFCCINVSIK